MKDPMTAATVTDPVCGMSIDPANAVGSSTYGGETYHFCSRGCETSFETAPGESGGAACVLLPVTTSRMTRRS